MIKCKYVTYKGKVLIAWKGPTLGVGSKIQGGYTAALFSDKVQKTLESHDAKFINRFVDAYPFPGHYLKPRSCQVEMLDFQLRYHRAYNLSGMRTGKSAPVSWEIDIQKTYNGKKRFLILAPLSTLENTWRSELFGICTSMKVFYSIHRSGGVQKLKGALTKGVHEVFVINFDKLRHCLDEILLWDPECVYIDEASDFNDRSTKKYKSLKVLMSKPERSLLALTGTPVPNRPTDAWAIARLINPDTPTFFGRLRDQTMYHIPRASKWVPKPNAKNVIAKLMTPMIRFKTDDVDDMPPHEGVDVSATMTPKQERMYNEMLHQLRTEDDDGQIITAKHAGSRLWKLLQIASGVCRMSTET